MWPGYATWVIKDKLGLEWKWRYQMKRSGSGRVCPSQEPWVGQSWVTDGREEFPQETLKPLWDWNPNSQKSASVRAREFALWKSLRALVTPRSKEQARDHALLPRATPSAWNPPSQDSAPPRVWASHQPSLLERCFLPPPQWEVPKRLWLHHFSSQIQLRTKVPWPKGSPRTFFCFLCTNDWI